MTQEDKELLLKDLFSRLLYDVRVNYEGNIYVLNEIDPSCKDIDYITARIQDVERLMCAKSVMIEDVKPYLHPINSITKEERLEISKLLKKNMVSPYGEIKSDGVDNLLLGAINGSYILVYWMVSHHFDYLGLIEKGLAIEAPEGMYNIKK